MTEPRLRPPANEPSIATDESVSLLWLLAVLVRDRRIILSCMAAGIALGLAVALLRPRSYTTTFSFIPQSSQDQSRAGLAGLAQQFGISVGDLASGTPSPQLYADLLGTRAVLEPIAKDSFAVGPDNRRKPLAEILGVGDDEPAVLVEKTLRALRKNVIGTAVATRTGMVSAQVRTRSPYVSLQIAERLLDGLSHFNLITRQSQAREERRFTEGRLEAARASLRAAEEIAKKLGDEKAATHYHEWFVKGQSSYIGKLWNGKYFRYDTESEYKDNIQSDQLAGQWYADMTGLGDIVPKEMTAKSLKNIYDFNVMKFAKGEMGAVNGIAADGTIITTNEQVQEVWTGTTLGLAGFMLGEGMKDEAYRTAWGIYHVNYETKGYWFRTPEAWDITGNYRASMYMRPAAIWAMEMTAPPNAETKAALARGSTPAVGSH